VSHVTLRFHLNLLLIKKKRFHLNLLFSAVEAKEVPDNITSNLVFAPGSSRTADTSVSAVKRPSGNLARKYHIHNNQALGHH
jgi:hypothetical protein